MSELSKQALKVENTQSFPNNNAGLITPTALRTFNENMIDSFVDEITYNEDSASWNSRIDDISGSIDTGSLLTTASFDNGTRNLTFTKGDSSQFSVNIPDASGSILPSGVVSGSSQIILQSTTGQLSGSRIDGAVALATNSTYSQNTITTGKNIHSVEIPKGTPLFFTGSGTSGNLVGILPADAGNPARMPAGGVAGETIAVGAEGVVLLDGFINGVNTSTFAAGQKVYVGVGGGYTNVEPTGSALIQFLGNVEKSAVNGSGVIQMMGEARRLPNLPQGTAWVGDSNGVPQTVATSSFGSPIETGSFVTTGSFNEYTSSNDSKVNSLISATGSYVTLAGDQTITGPKTFSSGLSVTLGDAITLGGFENTKILATGGGRDLNIQATNIDSGIVNILATDTINITADNTFITGSTYITGELEVSTRVKSQIFLNPQTLTGTNTIPTSYNGMLTGPVSNAGTIIVEAGSTLVII